MATPVPDSRASIEEVIKKGREIYFKLKSELEPLHNGKYVVIDIDSKDHFLGDTREEAIKNARVKYPVKILFVSRVGGVEKIARHFHGYSPS